MAPLRPTAMLDHWWTPKATNLLAVTYATALAVQLPFGRAPPLLAAAVVTIAGIGLFGHLVNDWHDREGDAQVGKANRLAGAGPSRRWVLVLGAAALGLAPWTYLPWDRTSVALLTLEGALLVAYAAPPLRLKDRPLAAIATDAAYAYAVPAVLAAHTFSLAGSRSPGARFGAVLAGWQVLLGARHYLNHVALDRRNDLATGTRTFAVEHGALFVHDLIVRWLLPAEIGLFVAFLVVAGAPTYVLPALVLTGWLVRALPAIVLRFGRRQLRAPYRFSRASVDGVYQIGLPAALLVLLVFADWHFVLLPLGHALVFHVALPWPRLGATPLAAAITARPVSRPSADRRPPRAVDLPTTRIAIVNINQAKYTETFVHGARTRLRCQVSYLHGGELPLFDDRDFHFLSRRPALHAVLRLSAIVFGLDPDHFHRESIAGYLQARRVRLILAHFGPVGARLHPIARDLGIPLIVWFHGYDVFHDDTVRQWLADYRDLFDQADRIVAVSDVMVRRLEALGAPPEKLVHLPAFVDLSRFPPVDHADRPPHFLAVGRFAETKSPHLTLLAFERVVRRVPAARLTFVGKGGGGELFEACVILARALGLEQAVRFRGVLPHADVAAAMHEARVFVQHSVTTPEHGDREGKPVAIMEAMACGLPVVSTRHAGIAELIDDKQTGLLVDEFDIEAMAEAMVALAGDDTLVRDIGRRASARIHDDPLIADHVGRLEALIASRIAQA
jgi:colanic acid/amylovoran biosynthesis glycosyltransferase